MELKLKENLTTNSTYLADSTAVKHVFLDKSVFTRGQRCRLRTFLNTQQQFQSYLHYKFFYHTYDTTIIVQRSKLTGTSWTSI